MPGPAASELRVRIDNVPADLASQLERVAEGTPLDAFLDGDADAIAESLVATLRPMGHLEADATVAGVEMTDGRAVLPVRVVTGPVYRIGQVEVDGVESLSALRVATLLKVTGGDVHDSVRTAAARDRLAGAYRAVGFGDVQVLAQEQVRPDEPVVDVRVVVTEGPQEVLEEIIVRGNRQISTDAVIGALRLAVGATIVSAEWLEARIRLFDTELFRRVDLTSEPIGPPVDGRRPMRAIVDVEEWPALRLRYGLELAENRPVDNPEGRSLVPGVRADLIRRTLMGRAVNVGATVQVQRLEQSGQTFLRTPTMFGWPVESQFILRAAREEFKNLTFLSNTFGVIWEQRLRVSPAFNVGYSYDLKWTHVRDTMEQLDPLAVVFDERIKIATLRLNASWDTRDDPSDATRGLLVTGAVEYAPPALGSEVSFVRYLTQVYAFRSWRTLVFATGGRLGVIRSLADSPILLADRFYSGGARTVRGVAENNLGTRDFFEPEQPAGGELLFLLNQEVRFPLFGWFGGAGFLDGGNVFDTPGAFSLTALTSSVGVGLRVNTPVGLFRVDYGKQIWNPVETGSGYRWTIGIGQAF